MPRVTLVPAEDIRYTRASSYLRDMIADSTHGHVTEQETNRHDEEHQSIEIAPTLVQLRVEHIHDVA
jgi:hypothetical protein